MNCGRDETTLEPPLPSRIIWGTKVAFSSERDIAELKRRLERCRRELACYQRDRPGKLFVLGAEPDTDLLIDVMGIET